MNKGHAKLHIEQAQKYVGRLKEHLPAEDFDALVIMAVEDEMGWDTNSASSYFDEKGRV